MKPERVITASKCSVCGLHWDNAHQENPSLTTCIEALKKALAEARKPTLGYAHAFRGTTAAGSP